MNTKRYIFSKNRQKYFLKHLTVRRLTDSTEIQRWNELVTKYHYLKNATLVGPQLRYVVEFQGQWIALLSFSSAALHLRDRDQFIGWSEQQRKLRLKFVVQNSRYLILPTRYRACKNLASKALSLALKRLGGHWKEAYGYPPLAVETFVDEGYEGACYRAANFRALGQTQGYKRVRGDFYLEHNKPKTVLFYCLHSKATELLSAEQLPQPYSEHEPAAYRQGVTMKVPELESLFKTFKQLNDSRAKKGRRYCLASVLALVVCAKLAKCNDLAEVAEFAKALTKPQRRALRMWKNPKTDNYEVPCHSGIWTILSTVDADGFDRVLSEWMRSGQHELPEAISIDGKVFNAHINDKNTPAAAAVNAIGHKIDDFFSTKYYRQ